MTSSPKDSHAQAGRRKKLTTIVFDTDFFLRPRTRLLIKKAGPGAVTAYMAAICWAAYEESGAVIRPASLELLAADIEMTVDQVTAILDLCASESIGYLRKENGCWISDRLLRELQIMSTKQENYKSGAAKRLNSVATPQNPPESSQDLPKILEGFPTNLEVRKEQEQEKEEEQEKEQEDPDLKLAETKLEQPGSGAPWEMSSAFLNLSRRPMRDYPEIWVSSSELANAIKAFRKNNLPETHWRDVFLTAQKNARDQMITGAGKKADRIRCASWLTGHCLTEVLESYNASLKVRRNGGAELPSGIRSSNQPRIITDAELAARAPPPTPEEKARAKELINSALRDIKSKQAGKLGIVK